MSQQVRGAKIPFDNPMRRASGARLQALVMNFRRKGYTASFGVDKDPKLSHGK